jgi:hypothetical protein
MVKGGNMNSIQAIQEAFDGGCKLIRRRKENGPENEPQYDVKDAFTGKKRGWIYLDHFTASAVMAVYSRLSPENQERSKKIPLTKLVDFAWKYVK